MTGADRPVVLVVDDEAPIRQLVKRILESSGYRVMEAADGLEALSLLDGGMPLDLLIADLQMPELSGEEMVQRIHATRDELKVLYVTGHLDRLFADRPMLREGEAFLDKPFSAEGLREAVSLLLTGSIGGGKP